MASMTTSWMWQVDDGMNAVKINVERALLEWYDSIGCACGDSAVAQTYAEFLQRGAAFDTLPDDVLAELEATVTQLAAG